MKFEDLIIYMIELYINNEIEYLYEELENKDYVSIDCYKKDLKYLESLNIEDINNILEKIQYNTNLYDTINETIQEYLYLYKKEKKEHENNE